MREPVHLMAHLANELPQPLAVGLRVAHAQLVRVRVRVGARVRVRVEARVRVGARARAKVQG